MSGQDADQGQRDWRHDHQGYQVGAELGHHQQVDQQQAHRVGDPHVAECLVSDLPLPIPLQAVLIGIVRLAQEPLCQRIRFVQLLGNGEQAIQRAVCFARHIGGHIDHREQVFVVDGVGPLARQWRNNLRQRDLPAVRPRQPQCQQLGRIGLVTGAVFNPDRHRILEILAMQITDILAGQQHAQGTGDLRLGYPEPGRLGPVHLQDDLFRRELHRVIHIHNIRRVGKQFPQRLGLLDLSLVVDAVDFGHQRGEDRRSGRQFDNLGIAVKLPGDLLQRGAHRQRHVVTLAIPQLFIHQVDLDIAQMGPFTQVILAHQTVETDRCGSAGVDLVIGHFRNCAQVAPHAVQHLGGALQAGALRHVQHDLELRFVIERQHLQHHRPVGHQGK